MSAQGRIIQADMERATKAAARAVKSEGVDGARVLMHLDTRVIEVIFGKGGGDSRGSNPFDEDD